MTAPPLAKPAKLVYFPHVEGLRGVTAFYVVLFHLTQSATRLGAPFHNAAMALPLLYGHYAVAMFIVISGFVLGSPVARSGAIFDARKFAERRFRRIYPAYALALFLTIPTFYFYAASVYGKHPSTQHLLIGVAAHLFLVHNLMKSTFEYLNPPMWSVGLECQIYVVFALILVPVWRKFGLNALVATALILSLLPHFVLHQFLDWTYPWFLGLFAFGVYGATIVNHGSFPRVRWKPVWIVSALLAAVLLIFDPGALDDAHPWRKLVPDFAVGISAALFIIAGCTRAETWAPRRFLAWWPIERLGSFSYSLYLVHIIVVETLGALLIRSHASAGVWVASSVAAVFVTLAFAYAFYLLAERPFLSPTYRAAVDHGSSSSNSPLHPIYKSVDAQAPLI